MDDYKFQIEVKNIALQINQQLINNLIQEAARANLRIQQLEADLMRQYDKNALSAGSAT